ncbi:hypothetical protein [Pseudomonas sp. NPDC087614]|uniref:hypothetical protein n=1 Tax=Pseudomonas sp. NPDC087614 TaxID=3364442 RepID=UPI00381B524E
MSAEKNVVPVITNVKDDNGLEIPNGGATFATSVHLSGIAVVEERVEILDASVVKGHVIASGTGSWALHLTGLNLGAHSITARGSAGMSQARTFTVVAAK